MSAKNKGMKLQPLSLELRFPSTEWPHLQENAQSAAVLAAAFVVLVSFPLYNSAVANISLKLSVLVITFPLMAFINRKKPGTFLQAKQVQNSPFQPTKGRSGETTPHLAHNYTTEKCSQGFQIFPLFLPQKSPLKDQLNKHPGSASEGTSQRAR